MDKAKTATFFFFPIFLGLLIGGVASKTTAMWVVGLILLILDIAIGIAVQRAIENTPQKRRGSLLQESVSQLIDFRTRFDRIMADKNAVAPFTAKEIVNVIVNLADAQLVLNKQECFFVNVVYSSFDMMTTPLHLTQSGFFGVANEIVAHFDLIAPYYKFCGGALPLEEIIDEEKLPYRRRAKVLLDKKEIFSPDWINLHEEFLKKFYTSADDTPMIGKFPY